MSNKKFLDISIDPGFHGYKICINDFWTEFSSTMLEVFSDTYATSGRPGGSAYVRTNGREYIFGDMADLSLQSTSIVKRNDELLDGLNSRMKFKTPMFKISIQAALAYALYLYQEEDKDFTIDKIDEYDIDFGVALPHDMVRDCWPIVKQYILCKHEFSLYITGHGEIKIDYDFSKMVGIGLSQVVCAYLFQATDDNGNDIPEELEKLPSIIVDGGYKTVGHFYLDKALMTTKGESSTRYAMANIHAAVAQEVNKKMPERDFTSVQVKEYLRSGSNIRHGKEIVEVKEIYEEELKVASKRAYDEIIKYEEVDEVKTILLTGGTGAAYFDAFTQYFKADFGDNIKVEKTKDKYLNKEVHPVFAIVLGLQKQVKALRETK